MSSASITGAMAAMAEPPQMPVPALIRLLVFQLSPSALPISAVIFFDIRWVSFL